MLVGFLIPARPHVRDLMYGIIIAQVLRNTVAGTAQYSTLPTSLSMLEGSILDLLASDPQG